MIYICHKSIKISWPPFRKVEFFGFVLLAKWSFNLKELWEFHLADSSHCGWYNFWRFSMDICIRHWITQFNFAYMCYEIFDWLFVKWMWHKTMCIWQALNSYKIACNALRGKQTNLFQFLSLPLEFCLYKIRK